MFDNMLGKRGEFTFSNKNILIIVLVLVMGYLFLGSGNINGMAVTGKVDPYAPRGPSGCIPVVNYGSGGITTSLDCNKYGKNYYVETLGYAYCGGSLPNDRVADIGGYAWYSGNPPIQIFLSCRDFSDGTYSAPNYVTGFCCPMPNQNLQVGGQLNVKKFI